MDRPVPDRGQGLGAGAGQGLDQAQPGARGLPDPGQAEEALRRLLASEGATVKAAQGATFGRVADAFLAALEGRIRSGSFRASTLRTYLNIIEKELRPLWGQRPIASVTPDDVAAYRARLAERDLAASTLNQTRAIVRGIFALAVERYALQDDVSVAFKRAKTRRATSDKISFYRPDEVMRLVGHTSGEQDAALFLTAAFTGCAPASCGRCAGAR